MQRRDTELSSLDSSMKNKIPTLDWNDTFLDVKHLRASFPDYKIRATEDDRSKHVPPFR